MVPGVPLAETREDSQMARSPQQIAEGVLACIPDSADEKMDLTGRFDLILASKPPTDIPLFTAPEIVESEFRRGQVIKICNACAEVLGMPNGVDWKQKVSDYLRAGR